MPTKNNFEGVQYRLCDTWLPYIQLPHDAPINYCEIGVFYGANLLRFAELFPNASLTGIDPWIDYEAYPEYKGGITSVYTAFCRNLAAAPQQVRDRITICKGFSQESLPALQDGTFDILYIDGNHTYEYVLRDAELAFQKVKPGGYIIFDDVDWESVRLAFFTFLERHKGAVTYEALMLSQTLCRRL